MRDNGKRLRFGEACVRKGFIEEGALTRALDLQHDRDTKGESHKLLGIILLEMGSISNDQLIETLKAMNTSASGRLKAV